MMDSVTGKSEKTKAAKRENTLRKYLGLKQKYRDIRELARTK